MNIQPLMLQTSEETSICSVTEEVKKLKILLTQAHDTMWRQKQKIQALQGELYHLASLILSGEYEEAEKLALQVLRKQNRF